VKLTKIEELALDYDRIFPTNFNEQNRDQMPNIIIDSDQEEPSCVLF
jgi:hypothetical protein